MTERDGHARQNGLDVPAGYATWIDTFRRSLQAFEQYARLCGFGAGPVPVCERDRRAVH